MQEDKESIKRVWYIVFSESKASHWFLNRLEYSHVYAMRKSKTGALWTVVEPTTSCIEACTIPTAIMASPMDYSEHAKCMIRVVVDPKKMAPFRLGIGVLSCVTVIKGLLGLHKPFILTPKQLMNYLEANNGSVVRKIS